jgi:predicted nucleotidyltransferase/biotin operon repressor
MTERERDSGGKYVETVQFEQVLEAMREASDPVVTASEVAETLGCSTSAARKKLTTLHENGEIARKKVGGRAVVWWLPEDTADTESAHEQAFEAFAERLTEACGKEIEEIILYGSVARGDHREHSDVDVMIIIEDERGRESVEEHASYIGFDVMLEHEALIAETIKTKDEFEAQKDGTYLTAVRRDGRVYATAHHAR